LGCYDTITATDPKVFATGLVDLLATYPPAVIAKAGDPARGIPAFVAFPNLAKFREQLERIRAEHDDDLRRERYQLQWETQHQRPEPHPDEAEKARIIEGFRQLRSRLAG
jgi:hypothetical protein